MLKMMRNRIPLVLLPRICGLLILTGILSFSSCKKAEEGTPSLTNSFVLTSPAIGPDSLLPAEYTCDGEASSLPLTWWGYPPDTKYFTLIMHHMASPNDMHWYWILYNIPPTVISLLKNETGIGTWGTNSVNGRNEYAPPCSQGPGRKDYILTVYALSEKVEVTVLPEEVDMQVILNSINDIILDSASMTVWYSRNVK